ncbi:glycosyltransferase family 2 protein [Sporolactobacillus sp. STSJ-5]|uniref:glycosyltransferase family 2 protein n=1 Tax=Sporolactobacillus sp. STSJ-5 TaxID=2965076 RepID=UPI0021071C5F|nr:glycosyltransferase family 2 protein [Sporolactobacillus sp. STSJ-5]MCQ2009521.1 glycosyltransferase family 2 protein [Sporolactobacillus sp. STSJ-5]
MINNKISVLINTFNEEQNIRNCLESVKWADEIIVVDMYSEDTTVSIAREYTDKIYFFERMGYADPARQFALEKSSNEWILVVDADELIVNKLKDRLFNIANKDNYDVVWIPRKNYFFGKPLKATGWGPLQDKQCRFFKKQFMNYTNQIHRFVHLNENAKILFLEDDSLSIIHFNYLSYEHFIDKFNRYTTIEAKQIEKGKKISTATLITTSFKEFINRYFLKRGYRDGSIGLALSFLMVCYKITSLMKYKNMHDFNTDDVDKHVRKIYTEIAQKVNNDEKC